MLTIDREKCTSCRKCETVCPTGAINIEKYEINETCIDCFHCLSTCQDAAITISGKDLNLRFNANVAPSEFELIMQERRTYRNFKSIPVSRELLEEFIHRMRYSPTASNSQSLHFAIVTSKTTLKAINDLSLDTLSNTYKKTLNGFTRPLLNLFYGKQGTQKLYNSKKQFLNKAASKPDMIVYNAPALIVIHAPASLTGMPCHDANIWTGMATLYAEMLELGTCINGYIVNAANRNKKIRQLLKVPNKHKVFSALLIGYPRFRHHYQVYRKQPMMTFIEDEKK
jgi:nitroreductase/NAD-dependent dihydropyrimidine dehydrogenase PreA subunit